MTQTAARVIEYAPDGSALPADRLLRRIVALVAILYGAIALTRSALHVALAKGWVASPRTMGWGLDGGWSMALFTTRNLVMAAWILAGLLLLRARKAAIPVLRGCAVGTVLTLAAGVAIGLWATPVLRSYWSTPAAAAMNALQYLDDLSVPALLVLLTLPPLARRMT